MGGSHLSRRVPGQWACPGAVGGSHRRSGRALLPGVRMSLPQAPATERAEGGPAGGARRPARWTGRLAGDFVKTEVVAAAYPARGRPPRAHHLPLGGWSLRRPGSLHQVPARCGGPQRLPHGTPRGHCTSLPASENNGRWPDAAPCRTKHLRSFPGWPRVLRTHEPRERRRGGRKKCPRSPALLPSGPWASLHGASRMGV